MQNQPLVPILMGSRADMAHAQAIADALKKLGIACEMRVASAHKTPAHLLAAKILSLAVPSVRERVAARKKQMVERILTDDAEVKQGVQLT